MQMSAIHALFIEFIELVTNSYTWTNRLTVKPTNPIIAPHKFRMGHPEFGLYYNTKKASYTQN